MGGHSLDRRERAYHGRDVREAVGGEALRRERLQERLQAEPAARAAPAAGRQNMVPARRVVAGGDGRALAEEDGACVADPARERDRIAEQDDVPGREALDLGERGVEILTVDERAHAVRPVLRLGGELEV